MLRRWLPYLLLIAALVAFAASLWRPESVAERLGLGGRSAAARQHHWRVQLLGHHRRLDANTPSGATIFFGSSTVQGLNAATVRSCSASFGIGGEESSGLAQRIGGYRSLQNAAAIVISTGLNDVLRHRDAALASHYAAIIAALPPGPPLILSSLPRLPERSGDRSAAILRANAIVRAACARHAGCRYVDLHGAMASPEALVEADGIHLNPSGYSLWARLLREALDGAGVPDRRCSAG